MLTIFRTSRDKNQKPEEKITKPPISPQSTPPIQQKQAPFQQQPQKPRPAQPGVQGLHQSVSSTTIGKDLVFEGNVTGKGSIRVEGEFNGKLEVQNEVIIGKGGVVNGDILAEVVTVEGRLKGNVNAKQKININVTGTMIGDIVAPRVVVASGAVYKGRIDMEAALKQTNQKAANKSQDKTPDLNTQRGNKNRKNQKSQRENPSKTIPGPPPQN
ncbi:polymer-forming cytoskeletal protein [bacterium]|nr:polymer-forming cytoskeletal protein [bacterium]